MASKKKARKSRQKAWNELTDRGKLRQLSKSPYYSQYMTERRRIQRQTRKAEAEGYVPTTEMLPEIPKKLTAGSVKRMQKVTPKYIRDRSDLMQLTGEEAGTVIKEAKVKPKPTKRRAVQQAQEETRKRREEEEFQRERRQRDKEERERLERDAEARRKFDEGNMIAEQIESLISDIEDTFSRDLSKYAREAWDKAKAGDRRALYNRLAEHPEVIDSLKDSYYQNRSGDHFSPVAFNNFLSIIQGETLSAEQMQDVQTAYERRQAYDDDIDTGIED